MVPLPPQTQTFYDTSDVSEVVMSLRRIRRGLTDTQRVVYDKVLDVEPAPPASQLATNRGVSKQRISKLCLRLRSRIEDTVGDKLDRLAARVADELGDVVETGEVRRAVTEMFPLRRKHCSLARRLLTQRIGYRFVAGFELSPKATEALDACLQAAEQGDADAVLKAAQFADGDEATGDLLMSAAGVEVWCGRVWRRGTAAAQVAKVFDQQGSPLTTTQVIEATGLDESKARETLSRVNHFGRAGYRLWSTNNGDAQYTSIGDAIRRRILEAGGTANKETVVAAVASVSWRDHNIRAVSDARCPSVQHRHRHSVHGCARPATRR